MYFEYSAILISALFIKLQNLNTCRNNSVYGSLEKAFFLNLQMLILSIAFLGALRLK